MNSSGDRSKSIKHNLDKHSHIIQICCKHLDLGLGTRSRKHIVHQQYMHVYIQVIIVVSL